MTEQPKDEGKAIACPRCGGEMIKCNVYTRDGLTLTPVEKVGLLDYRSSPLVAVACTNCGYTELYATTPRKLVPKEQTKLEYLLHGQPGEELI
jgi:predicted nucleic-acid-binding Zn-ribbon protein